MRPIWRIRLPALAAATLLLGAAVFALFSSRIGASRFSERAVEVVAIEALRLERPSPPPSPPEQNFAAPPIRFGTARVQPPSPPNETPWVGPQSAQAPPPAALVLACLNPDPQKRPRNCPPKAKLGPDRSWRDQAVWDKGLTIPPKLAPKDQARDPAYAARDVAEVKALAEPPCTGICLKGGYVPPVTYDPQATCEKGGIGPCVRPPERNAAEAMEAAEGG